MISRMFAEFLEEVKRLGGMLSPEQEFALDEIHKEFRRDSVWKKPELMLPLS